MRSTPKSVAAARDAAALSEPSEPRPAPPTSVVITERQVMFATAAAGMSVQTAVIRRTWIVVLWQRLAQSFDARRQPRRHYPSARPA